MNNHWKAAWAAGLAAAATLSAANGLLAIDNPAKNGTERAAFATVHAFEGNDANAMQQYGNGWQGRYSPRDGQNIGLLASRIEAGIQWDGYRLGLLHRADALVQANRDTSDLVVQYNTGSGYDAGRTYRLDYRVNGFEADGVHLSKRFLLAPAGGWQMRWGAGASLLRGTRVKLETASGQVTTLAARDLDINATMGSTDSALDTSGTGKFNPPFGAHPALSGQGLALDLGLVLEREDGLRLELAVNDLAARIQWKNLPTYNAAYNTATRSFDANGFVQFNPVGTAQSSYADVTQTLAPKVWLAASYPLSGTVSVNAATSFTSGYGFPELGGSFQYGPQWAVQGSYDLRFRTVELALQHPWFRVGLSSEPRSLAQSRAYGVSASVSLPF